jgi:hypothetical protein
MATGNLRGTPAPRHFSCSSARTLLYYMISFQIASIIFYFSKIYFRVFSSEKYTVHPLSNQTGYDILSMEKEDLNYGE